MKSKAARHSGFHTLWTNAQVCSLFVPGCFWIWRHIDIKVGESPVNTGLISKRVRAGAPFLLAGAAAVAMLGLAACDGAPSAVAARSHDGRSDGRLADSAPNGGSADRGAGRDGSGDRYADRSGGRSGGYGDARDQDTPLYHGKPIWAANRNHSAQENADYHFKRDGQDLGASSVDDFIAKTHAFIDEPPKGAQTLARSNGDKLIYDPKANLFAVVTKTGAPRTLFKPRDGQAYWDRQKDAVAKGDDYGSHRTARRSSEQGDEG
jgi:hypothetical protein